MQFWPWLHGFSQSFSLSPLYGAVKATGHWLTHWELRYCWLCSWFLYRNSILSCPILPHPIWSYPNSFHPISCYPIPSYMSWTNTIPIYSIPYHAILFYPIPSYLSWAYTIPEYSIPYLPMLSYPIMSYPILFFPVSSTGQRGWIATESWLFPIIFLLISAILTSSAIQPGYWIW